MARDFHHGEYVGPHRHCRGQLIYGYDGAVSVTISGGSTWVVRRHRGVWVPAGVVHEATMIGQVRLRTLFIAPGARPELPHQLSVMAVTPLFRELVDAASRLPNDYCPTGRGGKIIDLLLDEMCPVRVPAIHLPLPVDPDLVMLCERIRADPDAQWSVDECAALCFLSPRTLRRRFQMQTGYSIGRWHRQARLLRAVELLAEGTPVGAVAIKLGYGRVSAFSAMFRRELGQTPREYSTDQAVSDRRRRTASRAARGSSC